MAIGCKPWAVVGLPLVFVGDRRLRSLVVGSAAAFAIWAPFLAWPGALTATGSWRNTVVLKSPLSLLMTAHEPVPGWWRAASLSVVFGVSLGLVLAGRWRAALPVSLVVRLCIEPGWFYYYPVALVACLAVWDLQTRWFPRWVWLGLFFTATYRWREPGAPTVVAAALVVIVGGWRRRDGDVLPVPTLPEHVFPVGGHPAVGRPVSNPPRSVPRTGPPGSPRRIR
jgi:hypothetical protein